MVVPVKCVKCNGNINADEDIIKYQDGQICRKCINNLIINKQTEILWHIILSNIKKMPLKAMLAQGVECVNITDNSIELIFKHKSMARLLKNSSDKKQDLCNTINFIYNNNNNIKIILKSCDVVNVNQAVDLKDDIRNKSKALDGNFDLNGEFNIQPKKVNYSLFDAILNAFCAILIACFVVLFIDTQEFYVLIIATIITATFFNYCNFLSYKKKFAKANEASVNKIRNMEKTFRDILHYNNVVDTINSSLKDNITDTIKYSANLISDIETIKYELSAKFLANKKRPAYEEAKRIKELRKETKLYINEYKRMRYEYDILFSLFPELENYIEYYSTEKSETIKEIKENYDYVQSWISKDEYDSLDENARNQLALDKYIESRKKSKWAIGRDYEMFIGYEYEQKGYKVTYTGITDRLEDKGRDLIAQKDNEILIIQCKNWSKYKEIHENHICQLFGTTVQYNIENNSLFKATPVFITSATLSDTALKFAEYLGVRVIQNKKFEEFPRIKCNINNKEKIYHLPFDQQYDRTIIGDQKGEFFAWTVQEAVDKGFRRAKKYFYAKQ